MKVKSASAMVWQNGANLAALVRLELEGKPLEQKNGIVKASSRKAAQKELERKIMGLEDILTPEEGLDLAEKIFLEESGWVDEGKDMWTSAPAYDGQPIAYWKQISQGAAVSEQKARNRRNHRSLKGSVMDDAIYRDGRKVEDA